MKKKLISLIVCVVMLLVNTGIVADAATASVTAISPVGANKQTIKMAQIMGTAGIKIFDYTFTIPEVAPTNDSGNRVKGRYGVYFTRIVKKNGTLVGATYPAAFSVIWDSGSEIADESKQLGLVYNDLSTSLRNNNDYGIGTPGETYHAVVVMDVRDSDSRMSIYVNGELKRDKVASQYNVNTTDIYIDCMDAFPGTKGAIYVPVTDDTIDDFNYNDWAGRLSSTDPVVTVDDDNMVVNAGREAMSVGTLLSKLDIPDGASVKIKNDSIEANPDDTLTNAMTIDMELKYGNSVSYKIVSGFIPLESDKYELSLKLDGNSVTSAAISGIAGFTPVSEFLNAFTLGKDGAQIIGVEPSGDFVSEDMKLKVETVDGDFISFDLNLDEDYREFESYGGAMQLRKLAGKLNGAKTVIQGSISIGENALTQNSELYFEMDVKKAYPISFDTDGWIYVYSNKVGKYEQNTAYDYVILTDAQSNTVSAYINGMKVLDKAPNSELSSNDDPYELVGGEYDPTVYGDFLLACVYSEESFESYYNESVAMLTSKDMRADVAYDAQSGATVKLFVNDSDTLNTVKNIVSAMAYAEIKYYSADGDEITSENASAKSIATIEVTSEDGLHTNIYTVSFPDEIIRSSAFTVDEENKTIGKLICCSPARILLDTITVIRPEYTLSGIYRGERKLLNTDALNEGDVLRLTGSTAVLDYKVTFVEDYNTAEGLISFADTTKESVIVFEGSFTVPEKGIPVYEPAIIWRGPNTFSAVKFNAGTTLQIWNKSPVELKKGETYIYSYIQDFTTSNYVFYLNGVKINSGSSANWIASGAKYTSCDIGGTLTNSGTVERAYRVYSMANYVYKNDLGINVASPNEVLTGSKNIVNVKDSKCKTVADLLSAVTFKNNYSKEHAAINGNGELAENASTTLKTGMTLTVSSEGGFSTEYVINVAHSPITSYVFDVSADAITYSKGSLNYNDFVRYAILADGCELVVKKSNGEEVTSGNIETGMTAEAGGKTYTVNITSPKALPAVKIEDATNYEIIKTTDTYEKTITVSGSVTGVCVYLDDEKYVLGTASGNYTFTKANLTSGRHELYAVAESADGMTETEHYSIYAFVEETDRLRAARQPVVMEISYLDLNGAAVVKSDRVDYLNTGGIKLSFNKPLKEDTVNSENIGVYYNDEKLSSMLSYSADAAAASYSVTISGLGALESSDKYEIRISGDLKDTDGNAAGDDNTIVFKTAADSFDVKNDNLINASGVPITEITATDSVKVKVDFTNTSANTKNGIIVLAVFDSERMVGYSITPFDIESGVVSTTVTTNAANISSNTSGTLTAYRYIWKDVNDMSTLIKQAKVNYPKK